MTASIADNVAKCRQSFAHVLDIFKNHAYSVKIEDEFHRFDVYIRNVGAQHSTGKRSLDYRLQDASHIRNQIVRLLQDLDDLLCDARSATEPENDEMTVNVLTDESNIDLLPEIEDILLSVNKSITCLLRLSTAIRNPFPHDRFAWSKHADTSYFEKHDINHVEEKFPAMDPDLVERLGKGISYRRQYFKYREARHISISAEPGDGEGDGESAPASSITNRVKDDKVLAENIGLVDDDERSHSVFTQTSFATSITDSGHAKVPPVPAASENGPFECPFCYMILETSSIDSWKRHVFADLRPYVCVYADCFDHTPNYGRRHHWMEHTREKHWRTWHCPFGCSESFNSEAAFQSHALLLHPDEDRLNQVTVDLISRPRGSWQKETCPFCKEELQSADEYERHVGQHQEDIALFALPSCAYETLETNDDHEGTENEEREREVGGY